MKIANTRATGKCCTGALCAFLQMQLIPEHKCPGCRKIVHVLCGVLDEELDKYFCKPCHGGKYVTARGGKNRKNKSKKLHQIQPKKGPRHLMNRKSGTILWYVRFLVGQITWGVSLWNVHLTKKKRWYCFKSGTGSKIRHREVSKHYVRSSGRCIW